MGEPARAIVQGAARSLEPFSNPNIFGLSDSVGRINLELAIEMQRRPDPLSPLIMDITPDHNAFLFASAAFDTWSLHMGRDCAFCVVPQIALRANFDHDSPGATRTLDCGHSVHVSCLQFMARRGYAACPECGNPPLACEHFSGSTAIGDMAGCPSCLGFGGPRHEAWRLARNNPPVAQSCGPAPGIRATPAGGRSGSARSLDGDPYPLTTAASLTTSGASIRPPAVSSNVACSPVPAMIMLGSRQLPISTSLGERGTTSGGYSMVCAKCFQPHDNGEPTLSFFCRARHVAHRDCYLPHFSPAASCPVCNESPELCPLCLDPMMDERGVFTLDCAGIHRFHDPCVENLVRHSDRIQGSRCPACMTASHRLRTRYDALRGLIAAPLRAPVLPPCRGGTGS